jgi:hypothetical protein
LLLLLIIPMVISGIGGSSGGGGSKNKGRIKLANSAPASSSKKTGIKIK